MGWSKSLKSVEPGRNAGTPTRSMLHPIERTSKKDIISRTRTNPETFRFRARLLESEEEGKGSGLRACQVTVADGGVDEGAPALKARSPPQLAEGNTVAGTSCCHAGPDVSARGTIFSEVFHKYLDKCLAVHEDACVNPAKIIWMGLSFYAGVCALFSPLMLWWFGHRKRLQAAMLRAHRRQRVLTRK
jgi:hypothetical protein